MMYSHEPYPVLSAQGLFPPWDKFHPEHFPRRTFSTLNFWTLSTLNFLHPSEKCPIVAKVRGGKGPGWKMFGVELVTGWKRSLSHLKMGMYVPVYFESIVKLP